MTNKKQIEILTSEIEQEIASILDAVDDGDFEFAKRQTRSIVKLAERIEKNISRMSE